MKSYVPPPATLLPGSPVWAYIRDNGVADNPLTVDDQRAEIEVYCAAHGLHLTQVFADRAKSGANTHQRAGFLAMLERAADPPSCPKGLLLFNFSRFSRNLEDAILWKAKLQADGIVIHSLKEGTDQGLEGPLFQALLEQVRQGKRIPLPHTGERVRRVVYGRPARGDVPAQVFAFKQVTVEVDQDGSPRKVKRLIPDPESATFAKLLWKIRAEGKSLGEIGEGDEK